MRPCLLVLGLVLLASAPATARTKVSSRVQKVQKLYEQLFFDDAMDVCRAVLDAGKNSRADLMELLRYNGLLLAVQNKHADSVAAFKQLLVVNPLAKLDEGQPPRVQRAFTLARRWFKRQKPLMVAVEAPTEVLRRGSTEITAQVTSDPLAMVAHLVLRIRAKGFGGYRSHLVGKSDGLRWSVPLDQIQGIARADLLQYYVVALDGGFNELSLAGSTTDPHTIRLAGAPAGVRPSGPLVVTQQTPPPPASPPWYTRWWVWASVGAVVTVSIIAIAATTSGPADRVDAPITLEPGGGP